MNFLIKTVVCFSYYADAKISYQTCLIVFYVFRFDEKINWNVSAHF